MSTGIIDFGSTTLRSDEIVADTHVKIGATTPATNVKLHATGTAPQIRLQDTASGTASGALVDGGLRDMAHIYGWAGALWRGTALSLLERDTVTDTLLMDGIFVAPAARGLGVGTMLLRAIKREAVDLGLSGVRLDVIDTNPRARALYEREGFVAGETEHLGALRHIFGFSSATKMVCPVRL